MVVQQEIQKQHRSAARFEGNPVVAAIAVLSALGAVVLVVGLIGAGGRAHDERVVPHRFVVKPADRETLLRPENIRRAIERATDYLVTRCDDRGRFVYGCDLQSPRYESSEYNVLRHAGAIYALCQRHRWHNA